MMDPYMVSIFRHLSIFVLLGFVLSFLLVRISVILAHRYDVLARPSERGSHSVATPRLGGLGLAIAFFAGMVLLLYVPALQGRLDSWFFALAVAGTWALVGGTLDDILDLPASSKFLFQAAAAVSLTVLSGGILHQIDIPGLGLVLLKPEWAAVLTFALVVFWINAFNFMDGMDGHAAGFCAMVGLGIAIPVFWYDSVSPVALLASLMVGCSFGLFINNCPGVDQKTKTFMGDGGSHFLGLVMISLILVASQLPARMDRPRVFPLIAGLILILPFVWDVSFTLLRRLIRGENILKAHRSHLYQRLMVCGWSHGTSLLFSQVTWFGCFYLSQKYAHAAHTDPGNTVILYQCIVQALALMMAYTITVWIEEYRSARQ